MGSPGSINSLPVEMTANMGWLLTANAGHAR